MKTISSRIKILFLINDFSIGGAEMMLYKLLSGIDKERFEPVVASMIDNGPLRENVAALRIPVYTLGLQKGRSLSLARIWRLLRLVRRLRPDLIQGWMYHGNLAAQCAAVCVSESVPVVWNIRQSLYSLDYEKPSTARVIKLGARLSRLPAKIINNSCKSVRQHEMVGYRSKKVLIIPNGFDAEKFAPSMLARRQVRLELGVPSRAVLIGMIARFHPMKDHANFLRAGGLLLKKHQNVQFVLCGKGVEWKNEALCKLIYDLGIVERVHLLGERHDVSRLTASLDIACSSSAYNEGFPNVIGESMSCGVPCVVTDVGDSAWIVGDTGIVVEPRDSSSLSKAFQELVEAGSDRRELLGAAARQRVLEHFPLESVVGQYEAVYENLLTAKDRRAQPVRNPAMLKLRPHEYGRGKIIGSTADVKVSSHSGG